MIRMYPALLAAVAISAVTLIWIIPYSQPLSRPGIYSYVAHIPNQDLISIYVHGYTPGKKLVGQKMTDKLCKSDIIHTDCVACEYNDCISNANFAQKRDIKRLSKTVSIIQNNHPERKLIMYGTSRGAATAINWLADQTTIHPDEPQVQAAILESPFACIPDVADHLAHQYGLNYIPYKKDIAVWLISLIHRQFDQQYPSPLDHISLINPNIPILLLATPNDDMVPYHSTCRLAHTLAATGHQHVYLVTIPDGKHGFLYKQTLYQHVVNAFLQEYQLPHDAYLAYHGRDILHKSRITKTKVQ